MFDLRSIGVGDVFGIVGGCLYLVGYAALQLGFIRGQSYIYPLVNGVAAALVLIGLTQNFNLAAAAIQISWIVISLVGVTRMFLLSRTIHFTEEEAAFLARKLPSLPRDVARRLLDAGFWCNVDAGTEITRAGEPVDRMVYIGDGEAMISVGGRVVGHVEAESLIGEITALTGEPATATAVFSRPSRCFSIDAARLRKLVRRNVSLHQSIDRLAESEMQKKIVAMNRLVSETDTEPA